VWNAEFSPDETRVVTACDDHVARIWELRWGLPVAEGLRHGARTYRASFSADGQRLLTASGDGTARIWSIPWMETSVPDWFPELLTAIGGVTVDAAGRFERVPPQAFLDLKERLRQDTAPSWFRDWALALYPSQGQR
jgi:WD40 repeat protein